MDVSVRNEYLTGGAPVKPTVKGPLDRPVQLVVQYQGSVTVLPVTAKQAVEVINRRQDRWTSPLVLFYDIDLNGNPFSIDVGAKALAVYIDA